MRHYRVTFLLAALAVFSGVSGCSSKSESAPAGAAADLGPGLQTTPATSGTRLRAKVVSGGGARVVVGFHDTLRDEDCTFQKADGRMRCLPELAQYAVTGGFSDAGCQVPLTTLNGPCDTGAKYALGFRYDGSCGPTATELHKLGAPSTVQYLNATGTCAPQPVPAGRQLIALGDVVAWTEFVAAEETVVPGAPSERVLVASDGARQHLGFRLDDIDAECTFQVMEDGVTRCLPFARIGNVYYTDSGCTKAALVQASPTGPCVSDRGLWLEASLLTGGCGASRALYSLGGSTGASGVDLSEGLFSRNTSGVVPGSGGTATEACSSIGRFGVSNNDLRVIKADLTPSLPIAKRVGSGSGRLVPALVAKPGSVTLEAGFHDTELDVDCSFRTASDGKLRCLPATGPATLFFTDATCKSTSLVAVLGQVPCTGLSRFAAVESKTCPTTTRVYELGAQTRSLPTGSTETAPGRCASFAGVNNAFDATEVDVTRFVEGSLLTE